MAVEHRLAHQELLRALAHRIVVVGQPVVRRLEAVELLGLAADGERGEQHVVAAVGGRRFLVAGIEHLEGVARLHLALEVDVERIDADEVVDDRARHAVAQRGFIDALIERDAGGDAVVVAMVVVVGVGHFVVDVLGIDRDVFAGVGQRRHRVDAVVVGDDDAHRLLPLAAGHRRQQHAQLLAFLEAVVFAIAAELLGDGDHFRIGGAEIVQDAADAVVLLGDDRSFR